uniref:Uroplakin 3B n=1 Tax=Otus sunia TaxID=257818 RepID=A0A8C8BEX3_9STRI
MGWPRSFGASTPQRWVGLFALNTWGFGARLATPETSWAPAYPLLPYVPRVPPAALPGKLTATTFALERPCCVFDRHVDASDAVWLVVAFANGERPLLRHTLPATAGGRGGPSPQTLTPVCATHPAVLRVGGDTACGGQGGRDPCNGPLPSPGPYRVKFLVMGCHGPKAETRWSDPILLRRGTGGTAVPPRVPRICPAVVLACGTAPALCHHPKTWGAAAIPDLPHVAVLSTPRRGRSV